jgi:hypothetical protein
MSHKFSLILAILIVVYSAEWLDLRGQAPGIAVPDVAVSAKALVTDIHGTYSSQPKSVPSQSMPGGACGWKRGCCGCHGRQP